MERLATMDTAVFLSKARSRFRELVFAGDEPLFDPEEVYGKHASIKRILMKNSPTISPPRWHCRDWGGSVFEAVDSNGGRVLKDTQYSRGQSFFTPSPHYGNRTMDGRTEQLSVLPLFPKAISHERRLINAKRKLLPSSKYSTLAHGDRLGPSFCNCLRLLCQQL